MRLTTDKKVSEMGMVELARNSCYIGKDGAARYRDYSSDVDCRELIKKMMVNFGLVESDYWNDVSNEVFDDEMMENLMYGINDMQGLIALFYRNLWAMAELRDNLKHFEDLEEQGLLLKLPCKIGDTIYQLINSHIYEYKVIGICFDIFQNKWMYEVTYEIGLEWFKTMCDFDVFGKSKTVFRTKEEAEKALKRLEKTNENNS